MPDGVVARGLVAGAAGGIVGGWVKLGWEVTWPPRAANRLPEPAVLVAMFTHEPAATWSTFAIHFAFSMMAGIAFAAFAARSSKIAPGVGVAFGLVIWFGAHEIVMPLFGLTPAPWALPASEQGSEFFGHALWGLVIGAVFSYFRGRSMAAAREAPLRVPAAESIAVY